MRIRNRMPTPLQYMRYRSFANEEHRKKFFTKAFNCSTSEGHTGIYNVEATAIYESLDLPSRKVLNMVDLPGSAINKMKQAAEALDNQQLQLLRDTCSSLRALPKAPPGTVRSESILSIKQIRFVGTSTSSTLRRQGL